MMFGCGAVFSFLAQDALPLAVAYMKVATFAVLEMLF
jgi:hypothetical protein